MAIVSIALSEEDIERIADGVVRRLQAFMASRAPLPGIEGRVPSPALLACVPTNTAAEEQIPVRQTITATEVARMAHCSKKTIRRLELRGLLRRVQGFRHPALYTRKSVEEWLAGSSGQQTKRLRRRRRTER